MYFSPIAKKTKLKFDQDFKACWSICFELTVLNELKFLLPWVRSAFGNVSKGIAENEKYLPHFKFDEIFPENYLTQF